MARSHIPIYISNLNKQAQWFQTPLHPQVVFDAPEVVFDGTFTCPSGASFETRHEGCEL